MTAMACVVEGRNPRSRTPTKELAMKHLTWILMLAALSVRAADTTAVPDRDAHRARIEAAITAGDYQAWKAEHDAWGGKGQAGDKVTAENFATFAKMHQAMKAGDTAEAARLRAELGLPAGKGARGEGMGCARKGAGGGDGAGCKRGQGAGQGGGKGHGGCGRNR